uniref:CSON002906 protein n=1 Tax=Culicoides sonorensis TaxID=179676 RepID=A0A336MML3_CULSO
MGTFKLTSCLEKMITGKTTFIRMLAGNIAPDESSYKPQKISPKSQGTVRVLLHEKIRDAYIHTQFSADVMTPLKIDEIIEQEVQNVSVDTFFILNFKGFKE